MPSQVKNNLALYKTNPTSSIPKRKSALQIIKKCHRCIADSVPISSKDAEIFDIQSFDDLVRRKKIWFSSYQTIQYHPGQIAVLKHALDYSKLVAVFLIAATNPQDLSYLEMVLSHENIQPYSVICNENDNLIELIKLKKTLAVPFQLRSCVSDKIRFTDNIFLGSSSIANLFKNIITSASTGQDRIDCLIVPLVITKDHDRLKLYGTGSCCVQILEPFPIRAYIPSDNFDECTHFILHMYYDLSLNAVIFPSHLVAYLILYLNRQDGVDFDDLAEYITWFRRVSSEYGFHLGFTGKSEDAVEFALFVLSDYITRKSKLVWAKNIEQLLDYANLVTPIFAYQGIVAKAILTEFNRSSSSLTITSFISDINVKVSKDHVLSTCYELAKKIECRVPCRPSCKTIDARLFDVFMDMDSFSHYFKIQEPKTIQTGKDYWIGEIDSDGEDDQINPKYKTWIILTERSYRLDRLNMFMDSIESFIYLD